MKEEKLFYDPRSSLLLELVEEYIDHNLITEAETLLKDYLRSSPLSERALLLWIRIAEIQKDEKKEAYLREKLREIREKKGEKTDLEEARVLERKEILKKEEKKKYEEELIEFLKGIEGFERVEKDDKLLYFLNLLDTYFKKWGLGDPQEIIVESEFPEVGIRTSNDWKFLIFKKNTNFVTLSWVVKKLRWKK
ncbi:MAG: hypothetical protein ABDH49_05765 [Candidatus Hydrothermales bacterium]